MESVGAILLFCLVQRIMACIGANEGESIAGLVANGVHIYSEHGRILRVKPFVNFMPALLQAELMSLFAVLEKHGP